MESMGKLAGAWLGLTLVLVFLLAGCGEEPRKGHIGPPTKTVGQLQEWPEGLEPTGGGFRFVEMPAQAKKHLIEVSPEAEGSEAYFQTLRPR